MGIQYYSFQTYSRTESKSKTDKKGQSIYSIVGEAVRTPGFCEHVSQPKQPVLLFGIPFAEVIKVSEYYAENTFDTCGRAVRKNGLCAIFGINSAPPDMTEKVWNIYKKDCIKYLQETWGESLISVIEHIDEDFEPDEEHGIKPGTLHRHLHFACVPPVGTNFAEIHPAIKAKRAADKAYGVSKIPQGMDEETFRIFKKEGRQAGDRAYRNALKMVQDDFFSKVSNNFGLLRYGTKRLRLSREEIIKRNQERRMKQKLAVNLSEQEEKAKQQAEEIEKAKRELENINSEKQGIEKNLKNREKAVSDNEKTIKDRETAIYSGEQKQADFEKGLKTSLKGWKMPNPTIGEFATHYIKRVSGEVMGIVQRAMNTIKSYSQKKADIEKEKAELEEQNRKRQKQEAAKIAASEKFFSEKVRRLKDAYEKLKAKIIGVKTTQELVFLQKELAREQQPHQSR